MKSLKIKSWGLTSQIIRAAVSNPLNIAGGYGRKTTADDLRALCCLWLYFRIGNPAPAFR
ncbi:four helix bundle protein [Thermodesulfobacteriota bacterium]